MFDTWDGKAKKEELLSKVDLYFTHPNLMHYNLTIPSLKKMYNETKKWADNNPGKLSTASRYTGDIEHAKEELERIAKKSQDATNFILDTYLKYGEKII
jgi:hypothetical protein